MIEALCTTALRGQEVLSVTDLMQAYTADKHTADLKYKNTRVRVSDRVAEAGKADLILRPTDSGDYVKCKFDSELPPNVTAGSVVVVEGIGKGRGLRGNVTLEPCRVIASEQSVNRPASGSDPTYSTPNTRENETEIKPATNTPAAADAVASQGGPVSDLTTSLDTAKQRAGEELKKAKELLNQAPGYEKTKQLSAAQGRLSKALDWENVPEIQAKTEELAALNEDLGRFIRKQTERSASADASAGKTNSSPSSQSDALSWGTLLLILVAADWIYCFYQGLNNRIVLYFDGWDVFVSILGPLLLAIAYSIHRSADPALVGVLGVAGAACSAVGAVLSVKHNRSVPVGCAVAFFKLSFAFLWFALLLGQLGRGGDKKKSSAENLRDAMFGLIIAILLFKLMKKLINGRAVYAVNGWPA